MNCDCYLLIKFATRLSLVDAVGQLGQLPQVKGWDAVNGDFSLVVRVQGDSEPVFSALKDEDDSLQACVCHLAKSNKVQAIDSDDKPGSYIFVETEKDQRQSVAHALTKLDDIESCYLTSGSCDLVVVARADSFQTLDRLVHNRIRSLDGVLRIKQNRIISLSTL